MSVLQSGLWNSLIKNETTVTANSGGVVDSTGGIRGLWAIDGKLQR